MAWQRVLLGIAILAMSATMFIPLPLWAAAACIIVAMVAAVIVLVHLVLRRTPR
ncbi:hypothetical protein [Enteractinococcus coprophilus]|uniref:Uncharacterized protein n=1 Tax=Enteractinococcus coprophilus TaxID=1027633 RepID=A0A543AFX6_9MICC|nr:hypothetical protein [Enteractinococcus coprophilus]TQL71457.1 hypothetical protein FB556_1941 [Enteractinococcus coprophilus]